MVFLVGSYDGLNVIGCIVLGFLVNFVFDNILFRVLIMLIFSCKFMFRVKICNKVYLLGIGLIKDYNWY